MLIFSLYNITDQKGTPCYYAYVLNMQQNFKKDFLIFVNRKKFREVIFIIVSNDMVWCKNNLNDTDVEFVEHENGFESVLFNSNGRRILDKHEIDDVLYDFAIMAHCTHSILSLGTFGFWAAFLKPKGIHIYSNEYAMYENLRTEDKQLIKMVDPCIKIQDNKWIKNKNGSCSENL